jgi:hypothetical protein
LPIHLGWSSEIYIICSEGIVMCNLWFEAPSVANMPTALLGCDTLRFGRKVSVFRRNILLQSSG